MTKMTVTPKPLKLFFRTEWPISLKLWYSIRYHWNFVYSIGHSSTTPYIDIVLLFLHFLFLWDCRIQRLFGNRVALNPGLGGVRDVASAIISHEQIQWNWVCYFQTLDTVFPNDLFRLFVPMMIPGWPLTFLRKGQIWFLMLLYGKNT